MTIDETRLDPASGSELGEPDAEITLAFEDNRYASLVFGHYDQNLVKI